MRLLIHHPSENGRLRLPPTERAAQDLYPSPTSAHLHKHTLPKKRRHLETPPRSFIWQNHPRPRTSSGAAQVFPTPLDTRTQDDFCEESRSGVTRLRNILSSKGSK
jgi:hypothetical protein